MVGYRHSYYHCKISSRDALLLDLCARAYLVQYGLRERQDIMTCCVKLMTKKFGVTVEAAAHVNQSEYSFHFPSE